MLQNIRIVLVRTFHAGNVGSAARSMKTMGLTDLCLVNPKGFPSPEWDKQAIKMAAGAHDMLKLPNIASSLQEAIRDCTTVIASTARPRGYDLPELSPCEAAELLVHSAQSNPVALIFGPERMGLHNDDIQLAKYRLTIPANPEYSSLNMAAAVQILSYEIFKASMTLGTSSRSKSNIESARLNRQLPTCDDMERLHIHLEKVLNDIKFLRAHQGETLLRLRHLINRAEIDQSEFNIIRGILSAIERSITSDHLDD